VGSPAFYIQVYPFGNQRFKDETAAEKQMDKLRCLLGSRLLLGLEFLVAADVIHTVQDPNL
jgi:uncharacterized membrane protein